MKLFLFTGANNKSAQVLLLLVIPGHLIFLYTIHLMKSGHTSLTPVFIVVYLFTALLQVSTKQSEDVIASFQSNVVFETCFQACEIKEANVLMLIIIHSYSLM